MSNGTCLKKPDWTTCDREVDAMFCTGQDCACCRDKKCERTAACKDQGGYCIRKKRNTGKNHVCNGREVAGGCGPTNCVCCVPTPGK
ncbi:uncharacterized protein [Palaemon carinicauda]|uniref:uncharacterized protein n=1 Tax=Palaemon carinicauda TaxID=392227 RepID=UPI0035B5B785